MKMLLRILFYTFVVLFFISIIDPFGVIFPLINLAFIVVLGWGSFIAQTLPRVRPDAASLLTFLLCFGAFYGLVHFFGGMICKHITTQRGETKPWRAKWSVAIVSGCALLFAAGMSGVGLFYSAERVIFSKEPLTSSMRFSVAKMQAAVLLRRAEAQEMTAAQLRVAVHEYLADQDGNVRFLVLENSKGEWKALVSYEPEHLYRAIVHYPSGGGRMIDLRVDDLDRIIAEE